jgi:hypothetical protein
MEPKLIRGVIRKLIAASLMGAVALPFRSLRQSTVPSFSTVFVSPAIDVFLSGLVRSSDR